MNERFTLAETFSPSRKVERKIAFTLAEVLITLGIIGIVAAMTLPSLIQNQKKSETSARLKKFVSVMNQAVLMSELDNGPADDWNIIGGASGNQDLEEFFNTYFKPYIKYNKAYGSGNYYYVYMADGSYFMFYKGYCFDFSFDTNGTRKPNEEGRDWFRFLMCGNQPAYCDGRKFCPYYFTSEKIYTREQVLEGCKSGTLRLCTRLLEMDNWEFKDDYPYKL